MPRDYCTGEMITPNFECVGPSVSIRDLGVAEKKQNKIRDISIKQLDYGYVITVGCKTIALDTPEKILFALKQYFRNPENTERLFEKGALKFEK